MSCSFEADPKRAMGVGTDGSARTDRTHSIGHAMGNLKLLSLLSATACGPVEAGDADSTSGTSSPSTTGATSGGQDATLDAGIGSSQTGTDDLTSSDTGSGQGTDSGATSSGNTTTGSGAQDSTTEDTGLEDCPEFPNPPDVISEACATYVAFLDECYSDGATSPACIAYSEALCEVELGYYEELGGADCRAAFEDAYACLGEMSCREIEAGGCADLIPALEQACMP